MHPQVRGRSQLKIRVGHCAELHELAFGVVHRYGAHFRLRAQPVDGLRQGLDLKARLGKVDHRVAVSCPGQEVSCC